MMLMPLRIRNFGNCGNISALSIYVLQTSSPSLQLVFHPVYIFSTFKLCYRKFEKKKLKLNNIISERTLYLYTKPNPKT